VRSAILELAASGTNLVDQPGRCDLGRRVADDRAQVTLELCPITARIALGEMSGDLGYLAGPKLAVEIALEADQRLGTVMVLTGFARHV
jgi:hypothetical protein